MIYELADGGRVDTARDLSFEERNFIQKMMIYQHLGMALADFQARWRNDAAPVWQGPRTLESPSPAVRILLDMEAMLAKPKN